MSDLEVRDLREAADRLDALAPHARLDEACKFMFFGGPYERLRPQPSPGPLFVLDSTNYASIFAPDPLPLAKVLTVFDPRPSYGSVAGEMEIGDIVRKLENERILNFNQSYGRDYHKALDEVTCMSAAGATSACYLALNASRLRAQKLYGSKRRKVVYNIPCYCLPDAYARSHSLEPVPVSSLNLPYEIVSPDVIADAIDDEVVCCFLTYPDNPAQHSWGPDDLKGLERLIERCQERDVVLIADTIFQDLQWIDKPVPEVFGLSASNDMLIKVFSPSKDRPFACGYRTGYLIADSALSPWLEQSKGLTENTSSTVSQLWLALDCLFRRCATSKNLSQDDLEMLTDRYLFGFESNAITVGEISEKIESADLYRSYQANVGILNERIRDALKVLNQRLVQSPCFEPLPLPHYGNILMFKVADGYDFKDETEYFIRTLVEANITCLTGACFGMRKCNEVWGRIVVGGAPVDHHCRAIDRLETYLLNR